MFLPLEAELTETVTHNKVDIFYVVLYVKKLPTHNLDLTIDTTRNISEEPYGSSVMCLR